MPITLQSPIPSTNILLGIVTLVVVGTELINTAV